MVLHVSTDKRQLGMEYLPLLKNKLVSPLLERESDGVAEVKLVNSSFHEILHAATQVFMFLI